MSDLIMKFLNFLRVERGFSTMTVKAYANDLKIFTGYAGTENILDITPDKIKGFLVHLEDDRQNQIITRARKLSAIKSFFDFLGREKIISDNPALGLIRPKIPEKEISYLNPEEVSRLLETVRHKASPYYRLRDMAIIYLFLSTGIRLGELISLTVNNVDLEASQIKIRRKGNKEQIIPINETTCKYLKAYLAKREQSESGSFFLNKNRQGIGKSAVYNLVIKYMRKAGIRKSKISPHTLRHTVFTMLLNKGIDIVTIKELAGHRNIETTTRYLHITNQNVREAVNLLTIK